MSAHTLPSAPATAPTQDVMICVLGGGQWGSEEQGGLTRSPHCQQQNQKSDLKSRPVGSHFPSPPPPRTTHHHAGRQPGPGAGGWSPVAARPPARCPTDASFSLPAFSPQFSSPKLDGTWSPRRRRSSFRNPAKNSSRPACSKCPGPWPPLLFPCPGVRTLSLLVGFHPVTWKGGCLSCPSPGALGTRGQVFSARGPPSSLCMKGKEPRVPSTEKTCASDDVETNWFPGR